MDDHKFLPNPVNPYNSMQVYKRLIGFYFLITLFSTVLLGYAFFFIGLALFRAVLWLPIYWEPAYKVISKVFKYPNREFVKIQMTWWWYIHLSIRAGITFLFLYVGSKILISNGFLNQNLIYILLRH